MSATHPTAPGAEGPPRIGEIPRRDFLREIGRPGRPCILTGAMERWPARAWTFDRLRDEHGHVRFPVGRSYSRLWAPTEMTLREYLDAILAPGGPPERPRSCTWRARSSSTASPLCGATSRFPTTSSGDAPPTRSSSSAARGRGRRSTSISLIRCWRRSWVGSGSGCSRPTRPPGSSPRSAICSRPSAGWISRRRGKKDRNEGGASGPRSTSSWSRARSSSCPTAGGTPSIRSSPPSALRVPGGPCACPSSRRRASRWTG